MHEFTIGIEEEFQIVDPVTGQLRSEAPRLLPAGQELLGEHVAPEMLQSVVEVTTAVSPDIKAARKELLRVRRALLALTEQEGLVISGSGTHPFGDWRNEQVTEKPRYLQLEAQMGDVIRALAIWGVHFHVYPGDEDLAMAILDEATYFLPHLLALSTSSPFWMGRETGLKSYRGVIWNQMPRTGVPYTFDTWAEYEAFVELLVKTGCIPDGTQIWWDLRPNPKYHTIEFRVFDMQSRIEDTLALAALSQAIVAKLCQLKSQLPGLRLCPRPVLEENRWRAMRDGLDGKLIDYGRREATETRRLIEELLAFVDDVVDDLNCREEIEHVGRILDEGTSADRQLRVWRETHDIRAVIQLLIDETLEGLQPPNQVDGAQEGLHESQG